MAVALLSAAQESSSHGDNSNERRVAGSYEIISKIGQGAHGAVSKARHVETGELVAVKSSLHADGEAALLREAAMLAACAGIPAVVRLWEVVRVADADLHLVMEYVAGRSLYDAIGSRRRRRGRSRSRRRAAPWHSCWPASPRCTRAASSTATSRPGTCSSARKTAASESATSASPRPPTRRRPRPADDPQGTAGYMAPELLLGEKDCGAPVDVWALGCVMADLVAEQQLFSEEDCLCQQLVSIIDILGIPDEVSLMPLGVSGPSKLREKVPEERLSPAGFAVLQGLLEYDPKDRLTAIAALNMPWFAGAEDD